MNFLHLPNDLYQEAIRIIITIGVGLIFILLINRSIGFFFRKLRSKYANSAYQKRLDTFSNLIQNVVSVTILLLFILIVATDAGFNITPILTGAGILGLAISFGSQTLIKDLIAGFFIIVENQFNVGDTIKIATQEGVVVKLNLRTTVIRDKKNSIIYIPNSSITTVEVINRKAHIIL
jgi:small conductance mechanosensitive channel